MPEGPRTLSAAGPAPVLFVIAQDLRSMRVLADIDEADVGRLKEGMQAEVTVDAFPGREFPARITEISPEAEFTSSLPPTTSRRTSPLADFTFTSAVASCT